MANYSPTPGDEVTLVDIPFWFTVQSYDPATRFASIVGEHSSGAQIVLPRVCPSVLIPRPAK